jgi:hypothetical protein
LISLAAAGTLIGSSTGFGYVPVGKGKREVKVSVGRKNKFAAPIDIMTKVKIVPKSYIPEKVIVPGNAEDEGTITEIPFQGKAGANSPLYGNARSKDKPVLIIPYNLSF